MSRLRVFFYVQYLQGVGHLFRATRIVRALTAAGLDVDIVSGGMPVPGLDIGGGRLRQLAPVQCLHGIFNDLRDGQGRPVDAAFKARRRDTLLALFRNRKPVAVIVEAFPFGRRQMDFELKPLLEEIAAARPKPFVLSSVRDILQANRKPRRIAETVDIINAGFDAVLVHGDPAFAAFEETFPAARRIAGKIHYTGLVGGPARHAAPLAVATAGEVVVSAGGGATHSEKLLRTTLAAQPMSRLRDRPWRLLAGPNLPDGEYEALKAMAPAGVVVEPNRGDFAALLAVCAVSISQAGYNTVVELLQAGCRSVVVPYAARGETEQSFRAARLQKRKLAYCVPESRLTPETLAAAVDVAHDGPPPARGTVALDGAEKTAEFVDAQLAG